MTEQPGNWICPSEEKHYFEINNVNICQSPNCPNVVISESKKFTKIEELYCDKIFRDEEIYIHQGYGFVYDSMSCLEFVKRGILKKHEKEGISLCCFECNGELLLKEDGALICERCGTEIDKNTSLFLAPIYNPDIRNDEVKTFKL